MNTNCQVRLWCTGCGRAFHQCEPAAQREWRGFSTFLGNALLLCDQCVLRLLEGQ